MGISEVVEGSLGSLYVLDVDGEQVAELDILHHPSDGRRFLVLRMKDGKASIGTIESNDTRSDEQLAEDSFFISKVGKAPAFRRRMVWGK